MDKIFKKFTLGKKEQYSLELFPMGTSGLILAESKTHLYISLDNYNKGMTWDVSFRPALSCVVWLKEFLYNQPLHMISKVTLDIPDEDNISIALLADDVEVVVETKPEIPKVHNDPLLEVVPQVIPNNPNPTYEEVKAHKDKYDAYVAGQKENDERIKAFLDKKEEPEESLLQETPEQIIEREKASDKFLEQNLLRKPIFGEPQSTGRMIDTMVIELDRDDVKKMFDIILKLTTILEHRMVIVKNDE